MSLKNININGNEYELDMEAAVKAGVLTKKVIRVGQLWHQAYGNTEYLLCGLEKNRVVLISSKNGGTRWTLPFQVDDVYDITKSEWQQITNGDDEFTFVKDFNNF